VRQLTDSSGNVVLTKEYEPYGEVVNSTGTTSTAYGFTGEWTDNTGIVYLRARYYDPATGRFMTKDSWVGDMNQPMSYNGWLYVYSNPVRFTDPTGKNPVASCLIALGILVPIDGPLPIGDTAGLAYCALLIGSPALVAILAAHNPLDLPDTIVDPCTWTWQDIYNLPETTPEPTQKPAPQPIPVPYLPTPDNPTKTPKPKWILYHYTSYSGLAGILASQSINPSLADDNTAAFGHGQYFTDLSPADAASGSAYQLSRAIYNIPWDNERATNYVAINIYRLAIENVSQVFSKTYRNRYIYLHRSEVPLPIVGRLISSSPVIFLR
jgi:RHS repeat-associated protein